MEPDFKQWNKISLLIAGKFAGTLNEKEKQELEDWLNESSENRKFYSEWPEEYTIISDYNEMKTIDTEAARNAMLHAIGKQAAKSRRLYLYRGVVAASVIFFLSVVMLFLSRDREVDIRPVDIARIDPGIPYLRVGSGNKIPLDSTFYTYREQDVLIRKTEFNTVAYEVSDTIKETEPVYNTIYVPKGAEFDLHLSDGTQVWLNADSEITFPVAFGTDSREVSISGEAYFKVTPNTATPFRVKTSRQTVEVLGTEFNISAYPEEENTYTTLVSGSVRISTDGGERVLIPGMQSVVSEDGLTVRDVMVRNVISWRQGMFVLENHTLEEIMSMLARWYNFTVFYQDNSVRSEILQGTIPRYESFEKILNILEHTQVVRFRVKGDTITVMKY